MFLKGLILIISCYLICVDANCVYTDKKQTTKNAQDTSGADIYGIATKAPLGAAPKSTKPPMTINGACVVNADCNTALGLICVASKCVCQSPYFWTTLDGTCVKCPDGWTYLTENCHSPYTRFNRSTDAYTYCNKLGGWRLDLESVSERNYYVSKNFVPNVVYADAMYLNQQYSWTNGDAIPSNLWCPGANLTAKSQCTTYQTGTGTNRNCLFLSKNNCNLQIGTICKMQPILFQ